ncbi:hypothetical protein [Cupriavidus sp. USMAA2-4]|uniref:hypothetical protein n=1 Tax=Cupriavidus sp. USMAA2-4 TaxID=876364 RepID=UPI000A733BC5|nr:hypothetical protein [Cupriavidus sp. USMAA2-4]
MGSARAALGDVSGQIYKAFWYVPEIGRWVKSVEEYYASNGVCTQRISSKRESFIHAVN